VTPAEIEQQEIQLLSERYMNRFGNYLLLRMFANAQEPLNDEEYNQVVEQLLNGFRREQDRVATDQLKKKPGLDVDVEKLRIRHREAMGPVLAGIKTYLLDLRAAAKKEGPGWGGNA
jgi:hypothetical protein